MKTPRPKGRGILPRKMPAMMGVIDICSNNIFSNIADTTEELSRTPKMPFTKMVTKPRMLTQKLIRATALQELKSFAHAQSKRKPSKQVNMIGLDLKFKNFNSVSACDFSQELFTMVPNGFEFERVFGVFGLPNKVETVLTDAVPAIDQTFHFSNLRAFFSGASTKPGWFMGALTPLRTHKLFNISEKTYGGTDTNRAKARGVL